MIKAKRIKRQFAENSRAVYRKIAKVNEIPKPSTKDELEILEPSV